MSAGAPPPYPQNSPPHCDVGYAPAFYKFITSFWFFNLENLNFKCYNLLVYFFQNLTFENFFAVILLSDRFHLHYVQPRIVNGPTSSGPNPARTRKLFWSPNHARKSPKVRLGLKNLAILQGYFNYIFVHLRQKARFRPEISPKILSTLGPNPARTRTRPEKPGPTYNSDSTCCSSLHFFILLRPLNNFAVAFASYFMCTSFRYRLLISCSFSANRQIQ